MLRTVKKLHPAMRDDIGDLVTRRPLPGPALAQLDPFLFLNHHGPQIYPPDNNGLPFGPHPHRGFETVTFILDGELAHTDSADHASIIGPGGVQWMTAGSGVIHAELSPPSFKAQGGAMEILQLWVNLPARLKMTAPAYTGLQKENIPSIASDAGRIVVHVIAGEIGGQHGPIASLTDVFMSTATLTKEGRAQFVAPRGRTIFLYVVRGELSIGNNTVPAFNLVEFNDDGDTIEFTAQTDSVILFGHAAPLGEPVVAHGPFVMNTRAEINQAIADYNAGRFGGLH